MALSQLYGGTASISTTEYSLVASSTSLASDTTDAVVQLFLDLNAMVAGDEYELKFYETTASGGTKRLVEQWSFVGAQGKPIYASPSFLVLYGWDFTLKRIAGSDRSIVWSIRAVT
jgi:hypothetical protein